MYPVIGFGFAYPLFVTVYSVVTGGRWLRLACVPFVPAMVFPMDIVLVGN